MNDCHQEFFFCSVPSVAYARLLLMALFFAIRFALFPRYQVWDVAAMRIDHGLVLDKLRATTAVPRRPGTSLQNGSSSTQSDEADGSASSANAAACSELAEGLRWVWICLGRDSGLPAEAAALEACADLGISL